MHAKLAYIVSGSARYPTGSRLPSRRRYPGEQNVTVTSLGLRDTGARGLLFARAEFPTCEKFVLTAAPDIACTSVSYEKMFLLLGPPPPIFAASRTSFPIGFTRDDALSQLGQSCLSRQAIAARLMRFKLQCDEPSPWNAPIDRRLTSHYPLRSKFCLSWLRYCDRSVLCSFSRSFLNTGEISWNGTCISLLSRRFLDDEKSSSRTNKYLYDFLYISATKSAAYVNAYLYIPDPSKESSISFAQMPCVGS